MRYKEVEPSDPLKPFIKCFWYLERAYGGPEDEGEVLWPDGCQEIIFHYGTSYAWNGLTLPPAMFIGTMTHYHELKAIGKVTLFGARLLPWGLKAFANVPVQSMRDRFVPLIELFADGEAMEFEERLAGSSMEEGMRSLERYLLAKCRPDAVDPVMIGVLSKLYHQPLTFDVSSAAAESGYSVRHFERVCLELTGMPAKQLSKAARFNQARLRIFFNPDIDLHQCMVEFGYYDYAHFSKHFKQCIGLTPRAYQKWIQTIRERMQRKTQDVVFVQDKP